MAVRIVSAIGVKLALDDVFVVEARSLAFQGLRAGHGDHVFDPATIAVTRRLLARAKFGFRLDRGLGVRRNIFLILGSFLCRALAIYQLGIELAGLQVGDGLRDVLGGVGAIEDQLVQGLLELARELGPVGAHCFQPLVDDSPVALSIVDQPGVTLLAALVRSARGRHEKLLEMSFELHLQAGFDSVLVLQMILPVTIDLRHQVLTDFAVPHDCRNVPFNDTKTESVSP